MVGPELPYLRYENGARFWANLTTAFYERYWIYPSRGGRYWKEPYIQSGLLMLSNGTGITLNRNSRYTKSDESATSQDSGPPDTKYLIQ